MQSPPLRFRPRQRLSGRVAFSRVFDARHRKNSGPLTVYAVANGQEYSRLGISIGRRVGSAPARNRIKRRLREAFRLDQGITPVGFDWVIVVRPHETLSLEDYRHGLRQAMATLAARMPPV